MSLTEQDYKTLAIENGNTARLLAERLRDAERRIADADQLIRSQNAQIKSLRSDLDLAVQHNRELSIQNGSGLTEGDSFLAKLLRMVQNGAIDLTVTLTRHEDTHRQSGDNPE